jgi:hypothetical protein
MAMISCLSLIVILSVVFVLLERGARVGATSGVVEVVSDSYCNGTCNCHCCTNSGSGNAEDSFLIPLIRCCLITWAGDELPSSR